VSRAAKVALLAAVIGATVAPVASAKPAPPTISMSGSTVAEAVLADLIYFYGHAVKDPPRFSLVGGGTGIGIADVARGVVDAAMVSRNLIPSDPPGLTLTPFALSGVCLVTNASNPVPNLTRAQIQDIVAGRTTTWSQVPGSTRADPIVPAALDVTAGARQVFDQVFVDVSTPEAWQPRTFALAAQVRDFVEQTPAALGYVDLALTAPLHAVAYNGVACTKSNLVNATYPAQRPLGVVTKGAPKGALHRFLKWVATSRKARAVIATRYIPRS
jgi:phosphate transport system substrate-binding protein